MAPKKTAAKKVPKLNVDLGGGLLKYSRSQQYKRKALWRFIGVKRPIVEVPKKPLTVVKKINGAKNGGERVVNLRKPNSNYPTKALVANRPVRGSFKQHKRSTRSSLKPGRVLILLAGAHKGKRVVLLKVCTISHNPHVTINAKFCKYYQFTNHLVCIVSHWWSIRLWLVDCCWSPVHSR